MNRNLLLGYPRSGNNWMRYIIEYFSDYSTTCIPPVMVGAGNTPNRNPFHLIIDDISSENKTKDVLFYHSHGKVTGENVLPYLTDDYKLIMVVRNYKECLVRHNFPNPNQPINLDALETQKDKYLTILKDYHEYQGEKIILYYEDFIDKELLKDTVTSLCDFLGVKEIDESFFNDLAKHINNSKSLYNKADDTKSDGTKFFHSKRLTTDQMKDMDKSIVANHKELCLYLSRYFEES